MAYIDLHNKAFDDGTLCKLEIFEAYVKEWIPTFVMQNSGKICIIDLFAGPGYDKNSIQGSPIRVLHQINLQAGNIFQKDVELCVWFNEYKTDKYENLIKSCQIYIDTHDDLTRMYKCGKLKLKYTNSGIDDIYGNVIKCTNAFPSLVLLDQNGVKFVSDKYFIPLVKSPTTDFLFYIASSYIRRFANSDEFKRNLSFDLTHSREGSARDIHRWVVKQMQTRVPKDSKVRLYPFSIKKGANTYGIIFGASHPRAVDKFLHVAWEKNSINGEANYDIDSDNQKRLPDLFGYKPLTKIEMFEQNIEAAILSGTIRDNRDAYNYTLEHGHINQHCDRILRQLKKDNKIAYDCKSPKCNYDQVYKKHSILKYQVL